MPAFGGCAYMIRRWVSFLMCVMIHPFFPFRFLPPPVFAQYSPRTPGRNHRPASLFCFCQCPGARFRRPSHMSGADAPRPVSPRGSALVSPFKRRASACARPFSSICNACPGLCLQRHPLPPGGWFPAGVAVALSARGALRVVIRNFSLGPYRAFGANGHQKAPSRYGLTFPCGPFSLRDPPVMDNGVRVRSERSPAGPAAQTAGRRSRIRCPGGAVAPRANEDYGAKGRAETGTGLPYAVTVPPSSSVSARSSCASSPRDKSSRVAGSRISGAIPRPMNAVPSSRR